MTQHHSNPNLCPKHHCWKSWGWPVLRKHTRPSINNIKKRCIFHHRGLNAKIGKSRNIWSNRHVWPCTKWCKAKPNRVSWSELTGNSKHPFPTTQEMILQMEINKWSNTKITLTIIFLKFIYFWLKCNLCMT